MVPFCSVSPGLRTLPHHQGPCLFSAAPPVQGLWAPSILLGTAWLKYEGWDPVWGHETTSFSMTQHNPSSPVKIRNGRRGGGEKGGERKRMEKKLKILINQSFKRIQRTPEIKKTQGTERNSAVATSLQKTSFHSSQKERQCQRMLKLPHNCTHLTC